MTVLARLNLDVGRSLGTHLTSSGASLLSIAYVVRRPVKVTTGPRPAEFRLHDCSSLIPHGSFFGPYAGMTIAVFSL